jgi:hypothetical protein
MIEQRLVTLLFILSVVLGVGVIANASTGEIDNKQSEISMDSKDFEKWAADFSQKIAVVVSDPKNIKHLEIYTLTPPEMIPPGYMSYQYHLSGRQRKWDQAFQSFVDIIQASDKKYLIRLNEKQKSGFIDQVDKQVKEVEKLPIPIHLINRRGLIDFIVNELCGFSREEYKDWKKKFIIQMNELLKDKDFISQINKYTASLEKNELGGYPSFFTLQRKSQILRPHWHSAFDSIQLKLETSQFPGNREDGEEHLKFFDHLLAEIVKRSKEQGISFLDEEKNKGLLSVFLMSLSVFEAK